MNKVVLALGLSLLLAVPTAAPAFNWQATINRLFESIVLFTMSNVNEAGEVQEYACTAFNINEQENYWMTAAHCLGADMHLDGQIAWEIYSNTGLDIAILDTEGVHGKALKPSKRPLRAGMPIGSIGFAYGYPVPMLKAGLIAYPSLKLDNYDGTHLTTDFGIIGGMSGGPMVDMDGRVVAINQLSNPALALGRDIKVILEATGQFWQHR